MHKNIFLNILKENFLQSAKVKDISDILRISDITAGIVDEEVPTFHKFTNTISLVYMDQVDPPKIILNMQQSHIL